MANPKKKGVPDFVKQYADQIQKGAKSIASVRIPGGVIGKLSTILIFFVLSVAAIVHSVPQTNIATLALCLITGVVVLAIPTLIWFAHTHPEAALLEGSEFIISQQLSIIGAKNSPLHVDVVESRTDAPMDEALPNASKQLPEASEVVEGDLNV